MSTEREPTVKAEPIFRTRSGWSWAYDRTTQRAFFVIQGSEPGTYWYTDQRECTCPDATFRRHLCKHILAVRLWTRDFLRGRVQLPPPERQTAAMRLMVEQVHRYDQQDADHADRLLDWYDRAQIERAESEVDDPWLTEDEPDPTATADLPPPAPEPPTPADLAFGRPVWLQPGDVWVPDTSLVRAAGPDQTARPEQPSWVTLSKRLTRLRSERNRLTEPETDPRDQARHQRQQRTRRTSGATPTRASQRGPHLNHPSPTQAATRSYDELYGVD